MLQKDILEDLYLSKKMSSSAIARKFGIKHDRTVRKWLEKYNIPRRTVSESITKYPKTSFNNDTNLKAYILGLRSGDIHAKRIHKVIRIQTTTTHPAQIEMVKSTFGVFSHIGRYEFFNKAFNLKQWFVYCDLNESFSFVLEKPDKIPDWILDSDIAFYNFVSGYADSEGSWKILKSHKNGVRFVFQLCSQDRKILKQIVRKLRQMNYRVNIYLDTRAGIDKRGKKNNLDMYRVMVYQTKSVLDLITILLPLSRHQEKIDMMHLIMNSVNKKWSDIETEIKILKNRIKSSRIQNI